MARILYLSHAPEDVYAIIRGELPPGCDLVTLESNDDAERMQKIAAAEIVIVAAYPLTGEMIAAAPKLRLVHHQGVGWQDTTDSAALKARGIALATTPAGTTIGVAEHTVMMMLAVTRRLPFADSELRQGRWHINSLRPVSREIRGLTIGYVGMGRIAQAVAERLKPFGAPGLYFDPVALPDARAAALGVTPVPLDDLFARADIVTLHIPATPETRHVVDAAALGRMKRGAYLINTARGPLVDEAALAAALREDRIAGAALDVFKTEPPLDSPLLGLPNVVLTPHIAAGTRDALAAKMRALFANVQRFLDGQPLENAVDL